MGKMTTCTKLVINEVDMKNANPTSGLDWDGKLSPRQEEASIKVGEAVKENDDLLLWAVCGAGKTEMLFLGIETALQQGKYVCITTPRVDIVLELSNRFRKSFHKIPIAVL